MGLHILFSRFSDPICIFCFSSLNSDNSLRPLLMQSCISLFLRFRAVISKLSHSTYNSCDILLITLKTVHNSRLTQTEHGLYISENMTVNDAKLTSHGISVFIFRQIDHTRKICNTTYYDCSHLFLEKKHRRNNLFIAKHYFVTKSQAISSTDLDGCKYFLILILFQRRQRFKKQPSLLSTYAHKEVNHKYNSTRINAL